MGTLPSPPEFRFWHSKWFNGRYCKIVRRKHVDFVLAPRTPFFSKDLNWQIPGTVPQFILKTYYLQYFAMFSDKNVTVDIKCLKTMIALIKKICKKKSLNQAIISGYSDFRILEMCTLSITPKFLRET